MSIAKKIWNKLTKNTIDRIDACADSDALYFETSEDGSVKYWKLVPTEVSVDEYNAAWDRASGNTEHISTIVDRVLDGLKKKGE